MFNTCVKGKGVDCANFVASVLIESKAISDFNMPFYRIDQIDRMNGLIEGKLANIGETVDTIKNGDVLVYRLLKILHMGVYCDDSVFHIKEKDRVRQDKFKIPSWERRLEKVYRIWEPQEIY
jgi:hypothetical protein